MPAQTPDMLFNPARTSSTRVQSPRDEQFWARRRKVYDDNLAKSREQLTGRPYAEEQFLREGGEAVLQTAADIISPIGPSDVFDVAIAAQDPTPWNIGMAATGAIPVVGDVFKTILGKKIKRFATNQELSDIFYELADEGKLPLDPFERSKFIRENETGLKGSGLDVSEKLKEIFGVTKNPESAGFISHDGAFIDLNRDKPMRLSGGIQEGKFVNHPEAAEKAMRELNISHDKRGDKLMPDFLDETGVIRFDTAPSGLIAQIPRTGITQKQADILAREIKKFDGGYVETVGEGGLGNQNGIRFEFPVDMKKVKDYLKDFIKDTKNPIGNK